MIGAVDTTGDSVLDADGVLLTGEISSFGFQDSGGTTDLFDFGFTVTGGALAPFYAGQNIAVTTTSENSTFTGDFSVDFACDAKGNIGPSSPVDTVAEPAALSLFGLGLAGLGAASRRRKLAS